MGRFLQVLEVLRWCSSRVAAQSGQALWPFKSQIPGSNPGRSTFHKNSIRLKIETNRSGGEVTQAAEVYAFRTFICAANGRVKVNVAPLPFSLFSAQIVPPCASTIFLEIYRPSPVPDCDFEANFTNNLGMISGWIPIPVSLTSTRAFLPCFSTLSVIVPCCVNLTAFPIRLEITSNILDLSASTNSGSPVFTSTFLLAFEYAKSFTTFLRAPFKSKVSLCRLSVLLSILDTSRMSVARRSSLRAFL